MTEAEELRFTSRIPRVGILWLLVAIALVGAPPRDWRGWALWASLAGLLLAELLRLHPRGRRALESEPTYYMVIMGLAQTAIFLSTGGIHSPFVIVVPASAAVLSLLIGSRSGSARTDSRRAGVGEQPQVIAGRTMESTDVVRDVVQNEQVVLIVEQ